MGNKLKYKVIQEMKNHVLEEHHEDGTTCYVFLPPRMHRGVDGIDAMVED